MNKTKVGILVGSLRRGSYSKSIANAVAGFLPDDFEAHMLEIGNLPIYNQDLDDDGAVPDEWTAFRKKVSDMDGYLFVTPEYNRSVPPVLKNALDVASRPYGQNAWGGKPGAIISVSPGKFGGFGANHHLRQSFTFLNIFPMQQPEVYIADVGHVVDKNGKVTDASMNDFLQMVATEFAHWVGRFVS